MGTISDVRWDSVADKADLSPGTKIVGVNGDVFTGEALRRSLDESKGNDKPIHLILEQDAKLTTLDLNYHDGQRYPSLERVQGTPDLLDEITKPLSPATVLPKAATPATPAAM